MEAAERWSSFCCSEKGRECASAGCVTITAAARGQDTVGSCVRLHTN